MDEDKKELPPFQPPSVQPYRPPQMGSFKSPVPGPGAPAEPDPEQGPSFEPPEPPPYTPPQYTPPTPPSPQERRPERRRGLVGPVILIFLGVMFLLNNLGLVTWTVWEILFRFWPVWLIAIGIDMLIGRRGRWGGLIALALIVTMLSGVFYFAPSFAGPTAGWVAGDPVAIDQPLAGASEARIEIASGVARLDLQGGSASGSLIQGSITPLTGESVSPESSLVGPTAHFSLRSQFQGPGFPWNNNNGGGRWDLRLNEQVPTALTLETGVGKSSIDLLRLNLTDLRVSAGVGDTTLTLPAQGRLRARVSTGVGQTVIRLPESMAARIRVQTGIGGVTVSGRFDQDGDTYTTPNYDAAANRIDIDVEGGVGSVRIESISEAGAGV